MLQAASSTCLAKDKVMINKQRWKQLIIAGVVLTASLSSMAAVNSQQRRGNQYRIFLQDRSLDGSGNNLSPPQQGMAGTAYTRVTGAAYADWHPFYACVDRTK